MEKPLLVYTTFPDMASAETVGRKLVSDSLAACVNLLPGMRSIYAWKGAVETASEVVAIIKTREGRAEEIRARLRAAHPYETPTILFLAVGGGDAQTLSWLFGETAVKTAGS